jgi:ubiquinone/menaquinone biosynthesis C-methylase UbiE
MLRLMSDDEGRYVPAAGRARLTGAYDRAVALTMREGRWRPPLVAAVAADLRAGATAVEVGCGTGSLAIALAAARPDAEVVGVDGDPHVLALARGKPGAARVAWREGLAGALPLADASTEAAICSLLLHHLPDEAKAAALRELARVLGPGGTLHVADWGPPGGPATAAGARALQLFDGAAGPQSMLAGALPLMLAAAGFGDARRRGTLRTVWGTLELWSARGPAD